MLDVPTIQADPAAPIESFADFARNRRVLFKDRRHHPYAEGYWRDCVAVDLMPRDRLLELQRARLRHLIDHAVAHVPFYRQWAADSGYRPGDDLDYATLPITSKADYINDIENFQSDAFPMSEMVTTKTSGSSGQPFYLRSHRTKSDYGYCCLWRALRRFDIRLGDRRGYIWGRRHHFANTKLRIWRNDARLKLRDWLNNSISVDAYSLTNDNVREAVRKIDRFDPVYLHGYVTALYCIAQHLLHEGRTLKGPALRAVVTESEKLYDFQKKAMADAFQCPILEHYGSVEMGNVAEPDPEGHMRVNEDVILAERLDSGELLMTNLFSHAFPFIRYRQGDLIASHDEPPPGLPYATFSGIIGRSFDMLPTARGGFMHSGVLAQTVNPHLKHIVKYQVHQKTLEEIEVRVVQRDELPASAQQTIRHDLQSLMGKNTRIDFRFMDDIPPAPSGKFRWVTSDVAGKIAPEQLGQATSQTQAQTQT